MEQLYCRPFEYACFPRNKNEDIRETFLFAVCGLHSLPPRVGIGEELLTPNKERAEVAS